MQTMKSIPDADGNLSMSRDEQLAIAWARFNRQFPTEKDCLEEIYKIANSRQLFRCHHCGTSAIDRGYGSRMMTCKHCKKVSWITAGTFFNRMRVAKPWLFAIRLMEDGLVISSSKLHKLTGIAQSSALDLLRKLTVVIRGQMGEDAPRVPSVLFLPVFRKRSRETPARAHPAAEQERAGKNELDGHTDSTSSQHPGAAANAQDIAPLNPGLSKTSSPDSRCTEVGPSENGLNDCSGEGTRNLFGKYKELYDLLCDQPLHFDTMCLRMKLKAGELSATLTMMELDGLVERRAGDVYRLATDSETARTGSQSSSDTAHTATAAATIADFIECVFATWHGISRKYLQNYLAAYWCYRDRTRWQRGSLLDACLRHRIIGVREMLNYVTAPTVTVLPASLS